jgi:hypothetical protein
MEIVEQKVENQKNRRALRKKIAKVMKTHEDLFDLNFNEKLKRFYHNSIDTSLYTKPYYGGIKKRRFESSIVD